MSVRHKRLSAQMEGEFVAFLIGMRNDKPWQLAGSPHRDRRYRRSAAARLQGEPGEI